MGHNGHMRSLGTLEYDPKLSAQRPADPWWLIVRTCEETRRYYAAQVGAHLGQKLNKPLWGSHITVVRGEQPSVRRRGAWGLHQRRVISFDFEWRGLNNHRGIWWLPVKSKALENIRVELGLEPRPAVAFHWTLGRVCG